MPSKSVPSTPYELWTGEKPDLGNLGPRGSVAYLYTPSHKHGKLGSRGKKQVQRLTPVKPRRGNRRKRAKIGKVFGHKIMDASVKVRKDKRGES